MIGGKPASAGLFPFMVAITWSARGGESMTCSGFVVSPTAIMSAAHCLHVSNDDTLLTANYSGNLGNLDRLKGVHIDLQAFIHPKFNPREFNNDVSILKPIDGSELPLSRFIQPIALEGHYVEPKRAIAMGWGKTTTDTCYGSDVDPTRTLLYHSQRIKRFAKKKIYVRGRKSINCQGDSGSPLVIKRKGQYVALALLSSGDNIGHEYYTRILPQKKFILSLAPDVQFV